MKIKRFGIFVAIFVLSYCKPEIYRTDVQIETKSVSIEGTRIIITSALNKSSSEISEHGHCWDSELEEPILDVSSFTSLGPLSDQLEFTEEIELSAGNYYIRPYVIENMHVIYGESRIVQLD